jgi:hypothetical protein
MKYIVVIAALALGACAVKPVQVADTHISHRCQEAAAARHYANFIANTGFSAFTRDQHKQDVKRAERAAQRAENRCLLVQ